MNPDVIQRGQLYYIIKSDGTLRRICSSLEGHKVAVGCTCSEGHVRYCTPNSIRAPWDRLCQFCDHAQPAWKEARKRTVVESEMTAMQALRDAGIDRQVACEVSLPFWRGRVDFYHIPSKIVVQADGRSHRVVTHKLQPGRRAAGHRGSDC